jgi:hypothetical protein
MEIPNKLLFDTELLTDRIDQNTLIASYKKNNQINKKYNTLIPTKYNNTHIRIMSWNVRYWTNANNELTIQKIIKKIFEIDPIIICLQEITLGHNQKYGDANQQLFYDQYDLLLTKYRVISVCIIFSRNPIKINTQ